MLQPVTVTKLHKLVPSIDKAVDTNLGVVQMAQLAKVAKNLSNVEIVTQTMPWRFAEVDGVSYWYVDPVEANKAVKALFKGETMDVVQGATIIENTVQPDEEPVDNPQPVEEPVAENEEIIPVPEQQQNNDSTANTDGIGNDGSSDSSTGNDNDNTVDDSESWLNLEQ